MKTYLLDTNAFIWALTDVDKLGKRAAEEIANPNHKIYVSNVSLLECAIKIRTEKLKTSIDFLAIDHFMTDNNMHHVSFDVWSARHYVNLPHLTWADPFDAALIAQAIAKNMTLLTSDHHILELQMAGLRLIDANI